MLVTIIDDQIENLEAYEAILKEDFELILVNDSTLALDSLNNRRPELVLIDVHMPKITGVDLFTLIRKTFPRLPIIFISGDDDDATITTCLELGADDFVAKDIKRKVLVSRIKNKIVKYSKSRNKKSVITFSGFKLDYGDQKVFIDGNLIFLTPTEYKILFILARNPNKLFSREILTKTIWPHENVRMQNIDTHFSNLRKKTAPFSSKIKTIKSRGYILRV